LKLETCASTAAKLRSASRTRQTKIAARVTLPLYKKRLYFSRSDVAIIKLRTKKYISSASQIHESSLVLAARSRALRIQSNFRLFSRSSSRIESAWPIARSCLFLAQVCLFEANKNPEGTNNSAAGESMCAFCGSKIVWEIRGDSGSDSPPHKHKHNPNQQKKRLGKTC
jgi:hypothetical protein